MKLFCLETAVVNNSKVNKILQIGSAIVLAVLLLTGVQDISPAKPAQSRRASVPPIPYSLRSPDRGSEPGNGNEHNGETIARSLGILQAILPWSEVKGARQQPIHQGYTYSNHPVFWLSFDADADSSLPISVYFTIEDSETGGEVYSYRLPTALKLDRGRGVFRIQLPEDAPPLELGSTYQWRFQAIKDEKILGESFGDIERLKLTLDLTAALSEADLEERAALYAELGIWHELIDDLARLRCENPGDARFTNAWLNLLQADGNRIGSLIRTEAGATRLLSCGDF